MTAATPAPSNGKSPTASPSWAATSPANAWAVGTYENRLGRRTVVEHWDGKAWTVQPSPNLGGSNAYNGLSAVAATSTSNAWAVGTGQNGPGPWSETLAEHWDGKAWKIQTSPNLHGFAFNQLSGVATTSPTNAWAVGFVSRLDSDMQAPPNKTLALHCG